MQIRNLNRMTRTGLLVFVLSLMAAIPSYAQNNNGNRTDSNRTETTRVVERDSDTDWGWLGLLGLLGLAGLLPKKRQVQVQEVRDTTDNRSATGTGTTR